MEPNTKAKIRQKFSAELEQQFVQEIMAGRLTKTAAAQSGGLMTLRFSEVPVHMDLKF